MAHRQFHFTAPLWIWTNEKGGWTFVTLPKEMADEIKFLQNSEGGLRRGWGSVKVKATINDVAWETSIFPYQTEQSFILPIKSAVRKQTGVSAPDLVTITLDMVFAELPI